MSKTWEDLETHDLFSAAMERGLDSEIDDKEELEAMRIGAHEGNSDVREGLLDFLHAADPHPILD